MKGWVARWRSSGWAYHFSEPSSHVHGTCIHRLKSLYKRSDTLMPIHATWYTPPYMVHELVIFIVSPQPQLTEGSSIQSHNRRMCLIHIILFSLTNSNKSDKVSPWLRNGVVTYSDELKTTWHSTFGRNTSLIIIWLWINEDVMMKMWWWLSH